MLPLFPGVDHDALVKLAEQQFSGLRSTYESQDKLTPCRYTGSEVNQRNCRHWENHFNTRQTHALVRAANDSWSFEKGHFCARYVKVVI